MASERAGSSDGPRAVKNRRGHRQSRLRDSLWRNCICISSRGWSGIEGTGEPIAGARSSAEHGKRRGGAVPAPVTIVLILLIVMEVKRHVYTSAWWAYAAI